ncbi:MAG: M28 family peptidase, partial [Candidatus Bathyarchaeia archaeon]
MAIVALIIFCCHINVSSSSNSTNISLEGLDYLHVLKSINMTNIESYIRTLTSYGTRATGYKECDEAASFIFETLQNFGLNPQYEYFNETVPIDYGAFLEVYSENGILLTNFTVYPLRPNLVETCTTPSDGITGKIFYVGKGTLSDFNGKEVEGSIIVMDFDSQANWINAAKLGAKAVVFLEPNEFTNTESSQKYLNVPLDFPRVLIRKNNFQSLFSLLSQNSIYVRLKVEMKFENKIGKNIICYINGTDPQLRSDVIIISAYYDSYSIIPSLAPGAEESTGISVLLEMARFFSKNPPKRTLLFLALSGHNQALAGIRSFVNDHFSDIISTATGNSWKYKLLINLDFSSENSVFGVFFWGYFYTFQKVISRFETIKVIFNSYIPDYQQKTGQTLNIINCLLMTLNPGTMYTKYMFDSEPFTLAGGIGVTFATIQTLKSHQNTPHDSLDYLIFDNLKPQAEAAICTIFALSNDESLVLPSTLPTKYDDRMGGFASLEGQVIEYNYTTGWFTPVPHALVYIQGYPAEPYVCGQDMYGNNLPLYGHEFFVRADSQGRFVVHGVVPRSVYVNPLGDFSYIFEAYVENSSDGSLIYAPDYGKYATLPKKTLVLSEKEVIYPIVFKCGKIALYDILYPSSLTPLPGLFFEVNDFTTHFAFDHFGYVSRIYTHIASPVTMIFVPSESASEIIIHSAVRVYPTGWLINATKMNPFGSGFRVKTGECLHLTPIQIANDMHLLNEERIRITSSFGITLSLNETQQIQNQLNFLEITRAKNAKNYDASYANAFAVWAYEFSIYGDVRTLIQDSSNTIVFFTIMLIPFSILLERLLFEYRNTLKRSMAVGAIIIIFLLILSLSHPGFKVSPNSSLVLMGFTIACLILPALVILFWKSWGYAKEFRVKFLGKHFTEIS